MVKKTLFLLIILQTKMDKSYQEMTHSTKVDELLEELKKENAKGHISETAQT